jgi:hypothetical protein
LDFLSGESVSGRRLDQIRRSPYSRQGTLAVIRTSGAGLWRKFARDAAIKSGDINDNTVVNTFANQIHLVTGLDAEEYPIALHAGRHAH